MLKDDEVCETVITTIITITAGITITTIITMITSVTITTITNRGFSGKSDAEGSPWRGRRPNSASEWLGKMGLWGDSHHCHLPPHSTDSRLLVP